MKFTFASLMLLLVHTLIGVPLSAHVLSDTASAEANPADSDGNGAALASVMADVDHLMVAATSAAHAALTLGDAAQGAVLPVRHLITQPVGERRFELPSNWGSGDRHALDEGKP